MSMKGPLPPPSAAERPDDDGLSIDSRVAFRWIDGDLYEGRIVALDAESAEVLLDSGFSTTVERAVLARAGEAASPAIPAPAKALKRTRVLLSRKRFRGWLMLGLAVAGSVVIGPQLALPEGGELWLGAVLQLGFGFLVGGIVGLLIALAFRREEAVVLGADGVMVWNRFVPYGDIEAVRRRERVVRFSGGEQTSGWDRVQWTVSLDLGDGTSLEVTRFDYDIDVPASRFDPTGAALVREIEQARAAWDGQQTRPARRQGEDLVARGDRSGAEWLRALRLLGAGRIESYRRAPVSRAALSRLLGDALALPSLRAAAAIVLAESGDPAPRKNLRIAAKAMANPKMRIVLDKVAEATDDAALIEALAALEALEEVDAEQRS